MERRGDPVSITDAPVAHSQDLHARQVRYLLSMLVRTMCFVAAVFTSGPLRWVLIVAALFLPYIAVVFANAGSRRAPQNTAFTPEAFGALEAGASPPDEPGVRPTPTSRTG